MCDEVFAAVLASDLERFCSLSPTRDQVNAFDQLGMTPLLYAVYRGDSEMVKALLDAGADPNMAEAGDSCCTPLWHAEHDFGLQEVAQILKKGGAK